MLRILEIEIYGIYGADAKELIEKMAELIKNQPYEVTIKIRKEKESFVIHKDGTIGNIYSTIRSTLRVLYSSTKQEYIEGLLELLRTFNIYIEYGQINQ